jgi:molecular chaperone GrpE
VNESAPTSIAPESAPAEESAAETAPDPVSALAAELAELKDRHLRLQAEFENFRKRKAREADEIRQYAAAAVLEAVIPVLDHLDIALDPTHDRTDTQWSQGIDLIARHLLEILRGSGLEEVVAVRGARFQHELHEAVASEAADDLPPGHVVRVVRKGYKLRERLVRPAHVVVAAESAGVVSGGSGPAEPARNS